MTLLIDAATRSSVLLIIGLTFAALAGRQSAAARHAVLAGAILASGAVAPLAYLIPTFERTGAPSRAPARRRNR